MKRFKKRVLNLLIVSYLTIIYFTGVPETNTLNARIKQAVEPVAFALGIWPSWSMFAPNPIKFDSKTFVEITYKDGTIKEFDVEVEPKGILAPFRKARWMKYSQDNLRSPNQRGLLWPALNYFWNKHNSSAKPIASIRLKRKWSDVALFNEKGPLPPLTNTPRFEGVEELITQNY